MKKGAPRIVSPARAGMDPYGIRVMDRVGSFPRTRGDGPQMSRSLAIALKFPPHARGWTVYACAKEVVNGVSSVLLALHDGLQLLSRDLLISPRHHAIVDVTVHRIALPDGRDGFR